MRRLDDIPGHAAKLPADRRDHAARGALVGRVRNEFDEMPGMCLTVGQASRLCGISHDAAARIFSQLVQDGILRLTPDGRYRRRASAA